MGMDQSTVKAGVVIITRAVKPPGKTASREKRTSAGSAAAFESDFHILKVLKYNNQNSLIIFLIRLS